MSSAITFDNVSYAIGDVVILDDISLTITKGTITGILGPNGAGKTTLLSLITGLKKQTSGDMTLFNEKLSDHNSAMRQRIGVVLQETALYEELTTFENLRFAASIYNVHKPTEKCIEVLELLQLTDRTDDLVKTLSGGLRRRVAIARALIHDPELLIIDEPTLGVDAQARHAIWQYLRLLKSKGRTIVVATNYLDEAQALCDTVAVLKKGKLITYEPPEALIAKAGYCLDIECDETEGRKIVSALTSTSGIVHTESTPTGIAVFIKSDAPQDKIINVIVKSGQIAGLRVRAPDLAEVFSTLKK